MMMMMMMVRIHYRNPQGDVQVIDHPIHLRFTTPLRFLPSTLHLDPQSTEWVGATRMIVVPGKLRWPLNQLRYVVESKLRSDQSSYKAVVRVRSVSSIMSVIDVLITEGKLYLLRKGLPVEEKVQLLRKKPMC